MAILLDGDMMEVEDEPELEVTAVDATDESDDINDTQSGLSGELCKDADQCISDYFMMHSDEVLSGEISDKAKELLAYLAPRAITSSPSHNSNAIQYELSSSIPADSARNFLEKFAGEYVKETDIYKDEELVTNPEMLAAYIPVMGELNKCLTVQHYRGYQYMIVMAMQPELRDLAALALHQRLKGSNQTTVFSIGGSDTGLWLNETCIPRFPEMVAVMQKYKVKEIKPTIEELNRAIQIFGQFRI